MLKQFLDIQRDSVNLPSGPVAGSTLLRTPFSLLGPASLPPNALFNGYKPTGLGMAENTWPDEIRHTLFETEITVEPR